MTRPASDALFAIDTNIISKAIRGRDQSRQRLQAYPRASLRLPSMVIAELEYAALLAPDPDRYRHKWQALTDGMTVIDFDAAVAACHASLRHHLRHAPIGERDLIIAASTLAHDCAVVTNNLREFQRVPGLRVADWSG